MGLEEVEHPKNQIEILPREIGRAIEGSVAKFYIDWRSKRFGEPGKNIPENPEMPSWRNFSSSTIRRQEMMRDIMSDPKVQKIVHDQNLDSSNLKELNRKISDAVDYEIQIGVIKKYDNPEAARTAG